MGVSQEYHDWLIDQCLDTEVVDNPREYTKLLEQLYSTPYDYTMPMDSNRAGDGVNLRYNFLFEKYGYERNDVGEVDTHPCSMLEMMWALADRWELSVMSNDNYGRRTSQWFWEMIQSLGLLRFTNSRYEPIYVQAHLDRFVNRAYEPSGKGGLFTIDEPGVDARYLEIWQQANIYFKQQLQLEGA